MSDTARITVEIHDEHRAARLEHGARVPEANERRVTIEVTLPTGEGSEGPNLEGAGWEDALTTLVQRVGSAAHACLRDVPPLVEVRHESSIVRDRPDA